MQTVHLTNQPFVFSSITVRWLTGIFTIGCVFLMVYAPGWQQGLITIIAIGCVLAFGYLLILKSTVRFTLTATHFQQHLFKGGWVVKWNNIQKIDICTYEQDGWQHPLPWIGIKLKCYSPYINSICPRIATELLLSQRALLYLGARQHKQSENFEDIVLDSAIYRNEEGVEFKGLQAMLANRMRYQRRYFDYDIFIAAQDLDRAPEEFVGLARRYLAAAESEPSA